jgi:D-glycero-alpha-D-manno-heptose 1-phosphate guanylyltransferase
VIREAIVLAGGLGTRLRNVVSEVPKSMALVNGRPFLEYLFDFMILKGINSVILSTGYKSSAIKSHFKDHYRTLALTYAVEDEPLGTGGGIKNAFHKVRGEEAFVFNGDSLFIIDLFSMAQAHKKENASVTLGLRHLGETGRYGTVTIDSFHRIRGFQEKKENPGAGYINAGVYILNKAFITGTLFREKFSIEKDCFEKYYREFLMLGYPAEGYFLDIGIPEDFKRAQDEFGKLEY